jgi:hypothetical protein
MAVAIPASSASSHDPRSSHTEQHHQRRDRQPADGAQRYHREVSFLEARRFGFQRGQRLPDLPDAAAKPVAVAGPCPGRA